MIKVIALWQFMRNLAPPPPSTLVITRRFFGLCATQSRSKGRSRCRHNQVAPVPCRCTPRRLPLQCSHFLWWLLVYNAVSKCFFMCSSVIALGIRGTLRQYDGMFSWLPFQCVSVRRMCGFSAFPSLSQWTDAMNIVWKFQTLNLNAAC